MQFPLFCELNSWVTDGPGMNGFASFDVKYMCIYVLRSDEK